MQNAAQCLKAIAHPARLQMIEILLDQEMSVGELAEATSTPHNVASEHLSRMKNHGLLSSFRDGRNTIYRIEEPGLRSIIQCVQARYRTSG